MFPMPILNQYGNIVIVHDPNIQGVITSGSTAPGSAAAENRFSGSGSYMYMTNGTGSSYRYNADTNTWSALPARPVSTLRNCGISVTPEGNFVLAGGYNNSTSSGNNRLDSYSPSTNTWTQIGTLPSATWNTTLTYAGAGVYYWLYANGGAGNGSLFAKFDGTTWSTGLAASISGGGTSYGYYYNSTVYTNANSPRRLMQYSVDTNTWSQAFSTGYNATFNPIIAGYERWIWSNNNGLYEYDCSTGMGKLITASVGTRTCVGMNYYNNKLYAMFTDNTIAIVS